MTPEELKKIALESAKPEFENIVKLLEEVAKSGKTSLQLKRNELSETAGELLKEAGYKVEKKNHYQRSVFKTPAIQYWEISFK